MSSQYYSIKIPWLLSSYIERDCDIMIYSASLTSTCIHTEYILVYNLRCHDQLQTCNTVIIFIHWQFFQIVRNLIFISPIWKFITEIKKYDKKLWNLLWTFFSKTFEKHRVELNLHVWMEFIFLSPSSVIVYMVQNFGSFKIIRNGTTPDKKFDHELIRNETNFKFKCKNCFRESNLCVEQSVSPIF